MIRKQKHTVIKKVAKSYLDNKWQSILTPSESAFPQYLIVFLEQYYCIYTAGMAIPNFTNEEAKFSRS